MGNTHLSMGQSCDNTNGITLLDFSLSFDGQIIASGGGFGGSGSVMSLEWTRGEAQKVEGVHSEMARV